MLKIILTFFPFIWYQIYCLTLSISKVVAHLRELFFWKLGTTSGPSWPDPWISGVTPITEINCFLLHSFSFILFSSVLEAKWRLGRLHITLFKKVMPKNRSATKTANSPEFLIFTNYSFSVKIFDKFAYFRIESTRRTSYLSAKTYL